MTFTIKFYSGDGCRQIIREADSFTVLRCPRGENDDSAEITLHYTDGKRDCRIDIGDDSKACQPEGFPPRFAKAIIENSAGSTTEIVGQRGPAPKPRPMSAMERLQNSGLPPSRPNSETYAKYTGADKLSLEH